MYTEKRLQKGDPLEHITVTAGPSMHLFGLSILTGKEVRLAIKESTSGYPHNNFDAQFYGLEVGDTSYQYLNYREGHTDYGEGILSINRIVPWKVKVAIRSKLLDNTVHHYVHYEGTYDVIKREGTFTLIKEKIPELV